MQSNININICSKEIEYKELFYFFSYIVFITYSIFSNSFFLQYIDGYWKYCYLMCGALLVAHELLNFKLSFNELIVLVVLMLMSLLIIRTAAGSQMNSIVMMFGYAYCGRNISFYKISRITIFISTISLAIIVGSSLMGIIPNYIEHTSSRYREYLGFLYALFAPTFFANVTALYIYVKKDTLSWVNFGILFAVNFFLYLKTDSRLTFYLSILLLIIAVLIKKRPIIILKSKVISLCMVCSFAIGTITMLVLTSIYDASIHWMVTFNDFLGERLRLGQASLNKEGISIFGNSKLDLIGNGLDMYGRRSINLYNYVDCFYIQALQRFGIVFFVLFILLITIVLYKRLISKDVYYLVIMTIIALRGMIDDSLIYPHYNTFLIATIGFLMVRNNVSYTNKSNYLLKKDKEKTVGL